MWENVSAQEIQTSTGSLLFDDTVLDKCQSSAIDLVRRQYSGNAYGVIKGLGVVTCMYVNPVLEQFWVIDYRLYDPTGDGKSKLEHVSEMLSHTVSQEQLPFQAVLMDTWYATKDLMLLIESLQKVYYCPLKDKRHVDASGGQQPDQRVDSLNWSQAELTQGKCIKIKGFPRDHKVQCFRVEVSTHRTDFIVTNDLAQASNASHTPVVLPGWKLEPNRETKQVTGLEACQCRKARIQRNYWLCFCGLGAA